jgi:hypothetical protein
LPDVSTERHVTTVIGAVAGEEWVVLRRVLHPYLRFTDERGRTTRGRTKVIALLRMTERLETPAEVRLRDGQVYLWVCPSS